MCSQVLPDRATSFKTQWAVSDLIAGGHMCQAMGCQQGQVTGCFPLLAAPAQCCRSSAPPPPMFDIASRAFISAPLLNPSLIESGWIRTACYCSTLVTVKREWVYVYVHGNKQRVNIISSHLSPLVRLAELKRGGPAEDALIKCAHCGKVNMYVSCHHNWPLWQISAFTEYKRLVLSVAQSTLICIWFNVSLVKAVMIACLRLTAQSLDPPCCSFLYINVVYINCQMCAGMNIQYNIQILYMKT